MTSTVEPGKHVQQYSEEEWSYIIEHVKLQSQLKYKTPDLGTGQLARYIDHTLLKPDATTEQIERLCAEAKEYNFKSVCVRLHHVSHAVQCLHRCDVGVACVVGFHEGTYSTEEKLHEALAAVHAGASELDIVLNHSLFKTDLFKRSLDKIGEELHQLRQRIKPPVVLKLILETSQLSQQQIISVCLIARTEGFDFVKTSTGFNGQGATVENVRLMKEAAGATMGVKASGGVKTLQDCLSMIEAGASRIGTSSGVTIMKEEMIAVQGAVGAQDKVTAATTNEDGGY